MGVWRETLEVNGCGRLEDGLGGLLRSSDDNRSVENAGKFSGLARVYLFKLSRDLRSTKINRSSLRGYKNSIPFSKGMHA